MARSGKSRSRFTSAPSFRPNRWQPTTRGGLRRTGLCDRFWWKRSAPEAFAGCTVSPPRDQSQPDLATELDEMEAIFAGAAAAVSRELGLPEPVSAAPGPAAGRSADSDRKAFSQWAQTKNTDPDVGRDARMMVPVFFDLGRRKTKVWVFLGWSQRPVHFWFATPPSVEVTRNGKPAATR